MVTGKPALDRYNRDRLLVKIHLIYCTLNTLQYPTTTTTTTTYEIRKGERESSIRFKTESLPSGLRRSRAGLGATTIGTIMSEANANKKHLRRRSNPDFARAKQVREDQERHARPEPKYDFWNPSDRAQYRADRRKETREQKLNRLVPDRVCPFCLLKKPKSTSWIVRARTAICRVCFKERPNMGKERKNLDRNIFFTPPVRFALNSEVLIIAREAAGLSKSEFCRRVGWTRQRQENLESGVVKSVDTDVAAKILRVLLSQNVHTSEPATVMHQLKL